MKESEITYRRLNILDRSKLLLLKQTIQETSERQDFITPYGEEELQQLFEKDKYANFGAFDKHFLVGSTRLGADKEKLNRYHNMLNTDKKIGYISKLFVHPEYRRGGICTSLMEMTLNEAQNEHDEIAVAITHPENEMGRGLLKKLHFKEVCEIKTNTPGIVFERDLD